MKTLALVSAASLSLALGGCAEIQKATNYLAAPTTTQAAQNLKTLATAFDCGLVVTGAQLAQNIAALVNAGQSAIGTTGKVYAVSQAICTALQGTPNTTTVAPVSSAPVTVQ